MAYLISNEELIAALHELRWHEDLPQEVNGLNSNTLIETVVDLLKSYNLANLDLEDKN